MSAIALVASNSGSVSGGSSAVTTDCEVSLDLSALPTASGDSQDGEAEPCVVNATPRSSGERGSRVEVTFNGGCDGIRVGLRIDVSAISQTPSDDSVVSGTSTGLTTVLAEVLGNDPIGLDLFYNRVVATWEHSATEVISAYYQPSTGDSDTPTNWTVESVSHCGRRISRQWYRAVQIAWFHIHILILADTRVYTYVALDAKPGGAFSCDFSPSYWINPHLNPYFEFTCEPQ